MNNETLVFGSYSKEPSQTSKDLEQRIKQQTQHLLDTLDLIPSADPAIIKAAKKDIVTGMMWAVKALYAG